MQFVVLAKQMIMLLVVFFILPGKWMCTVCFRYHNNCWNRIAFILEAV